MGKQLVCKGKRQEGKEGCREGGRDGGRMEEIN